MTLALCVIFFLSGASALLFETLWFRLAGFTFGNSLWASSLVLAAFMGGLGLGNLLAARVGPRLKRPLAAYAFVEVVIGVVGLLLVLVFPLLTPVLAPVFRPFLDTPWVLQPLRLVFAFVLLLVPATAMGVTLPLLVKTLSARDSNFGRVLGRLYGVNTLGAVVGALAGELYFIGLLGLRGTGVVAAALNFIAAFASLALAKKLGATDTADGGVSSGTARGQRALRILGAAFLAGGLLLGLEVVWFRFLQLFVLGSSMIFSVMLAVVLLGIGAGGIIASMWLGARPGDYRHAPLVAVAASVLTAFTYILFDDGFGWYGPFPIKPVPEPRTAFAITMALCGPVSILSGILFTFFGRALRDELGDETRATAEITFANTLGAMLGSLLAGFVLIPSFGVEWSLFILAVVYLVAALASLVAGTATTERSQGERFAFRASGMLALLFFAFFPFGLMQNHYIPMTTRLHMMDGSQLVAMREGRTETAIYLRGDLWDVPRHYRLITNGFAMSASITRSERYMSLFAYWPAAMHPDPKKALLISYGVGVTANALTQIRELETIDIVDISESVLELNREVGMFEGDHPLDDPRVRVHIEDGRFYLQTTGERYDIITAEPPPPKNAGIVNLYTREYFQWLHDRLAPGGLATYWLPVYQLGLDEAKAVSRAFCAAFADCSLWSSAGTEWMLAGSRDAPRKVDDATFSRIWASPGISTGLATIGVETPAQLGTLFLGDARFLETWVGDVPVLEDNYPHRISARIQYHAQDFYPAMEEYERVMAVDGAADRFYESEWIERFWPGGAREGAREYFPYQASLNRHFEGGASTIGDLKEALTESQLRALPILLLNASDHDVVIADQAAAAGVSDPGVFYYQAARALSQRAYADAAADYEHALRLDPGMLDIAQYRIFSLHMAGETEKARAAAELVRTRAPGAVGRPGFWEWYEEASGAPDADALH